MNDIADSLDLIREAIPSARCLARCSLRLFCFFHLGALQQRSKN